MDLRVGFYANSVPFHLHGVGGSGAPHEFLFSRRRDLGALDAQVLETVLYLQETSVQCHVHCFSRIAVQRDFEPTMESRC